MPPTKSIYNMRKYSKTVFIIGIVCFCLANTIFAAPVITAGSMSKTAFYNQLGDNIPTIDPIHPYSFDSGLEITGGNLMKATLKNPDGVCYEYILYTSRKGNVFSNLKDTSALNKYFPIGNYTLNISTTAGNTTSIVKNIKNDFPVPPRIISGNNTAWSNNYLFIINNNSTCSIKWNDPSKDVENVGVALDNDRLVDNLSKTASSYTLNKSIVESLPFNTPIPFYVHFYSSETGSGTHVYLYKIKFDDFGVFKIQKNHAFFQTDNTDPSEWGTKKSTQFFKDYGPYSLTMECTRTGNVIDPKGNKLALTFKSPNESAYSSGPISSKYELNNLYPDGTYTLANQSVALTGSMYPNSGSPIKILYVNGKYPEWRDGKLVLNPKSKNLIEWTPFAINSNEFPQKGIIEFKIDYLTPYFQTFEQKESGLLTNSTSKFNSFTINASTMSADRDYFMSIKYFLASSVNAATQSGGGYSTNTYIWITPTGK